MADAISVAVGKAVTSRIQQLESGQQFSQRFEIERSYADWDFDLAKADLREYREGDKTRADVVSHMTAQTVSAVSRGGIKFIVPVDIAVRRKFGADKQNEDTGRVAVAEIDKLALLVQEIHLQFTQRHLSDFPFAVWDEEEGGTNILVCPNRDHLRKMRQFTGIVRVFFRVDQKINAGN